jgi:hypothetical protein
MSDCGISVEESGFVGMFVSKPVNKSTSKPVNKSTSKPVNKSTSKPVNKSTSKPVNKSTSKPVNKNTVDSESDCESDVDLLTDLDSEVDCESDVGLLTELDTELDTDSDCVVPAPTKSVSASNIRPRGRPTKKEAQKRELAKTADEKSIEYQTIMVRKLKPKMRRSKDITDAEIKQYARNIATKPSDVSDNVFANRLDMYFKSNKMDFNTVFITLDTLKSIYSHSDVGLSNEFNYLLQCYKLVILSGKHKKNTNLKYLINGAHYLDDKTDNRLVRYYKNVNFDCSYILTRIGVIIDNTSISNLVEELRWLTCLITWSII